jgi:type II secretory pathway component PulF
MKLDEFAFLNQQLAGMLRAGIPLEGSLRELSATMRHGKLRAEIEALEKDLSTGVPLPDAVNKRQLPELYIRLTQAGATGGDLPGVLIMLADYYNRLAAITSRLKGLMVYPFIVLLASFAVSVLISMIFRALVVNLFEDPDWFFMSSRNNGFLFAGVWLPTAVLGGLTLVWLVVVSAPRLRNWARWKLPGFREASLAQISGAAALLLRSGTTLHSALALLQNAEPKSPAGREIGRWLDLHRQGASKWNAFTADSRVFPPLFRWVVAQGGEDLALGFQRASEIYQSRASRKIDVLLFAAMPMAVLLVAGIIVTQMYPVMNAVKALLDGLSGM